MQENNNKNNDNSQEPTLSEVTETKEGTSEQGALKTIHREYNKLNGYEAMLHIINRYRFVLYPFIFLSVAGSSYSFFNDFLKAFPMLGDTANLTVAIFFSVMLEIVRDGSLIALFNSKMKLPSRLLVVTIFIVVTTYMYSSHLKAIDVIEKMAVEYALTHQDQESIKATNPRYQVAVKELERLESNLVSKRAEKTPELIANSTSIHTKKREDALARIDKIEREIKAIEASIKAKNMEIVGYQEGNIKSIEDSQKLISTILLATLLLVESLAMLGAVIKFINTNNAKKEIAKHSEIVEEYVEISEQMRADNEALTKNLSHVVRGQSKSNQQVMQMISDDMQESANLNIQFIEAIAQNKRQTMQQMNQVLEAINQGTAPSFSGPMQEVSHFKDNSNEHTSPQVGFKPTFTKKTTEQLIKDLDLKKVITGVNNHGIIYAYLYKDHLIQNNREAIITKPKSGFIKSDPKVFNGSPFIETSIYNAYHEPLYTGKQAPLYELIEIIDLSSTKKAISRRKEKPSYSFKAKNLKRRLKNVNKNIL